MKQKTNLNAKLFDTTPIGNLNSSILVQTLKRFHNEINHQHTTIGSIDNSKRQKLAALQ